MTDSKATPRVALVAGAVVVGAAAWACWPTLPQLSQRWRTDAQYSYGFLVPVFAAFLLWARRGMLAGVRPAPSAWGLALLAVGAAMRLLGAYFYFVWVEQFALLPILAGVALALGGWGVWRWAWPAVAFLAFMVPMPGRLDGALAHPLQRIATESSAYVLQVCGVPAAAEGNVLLLSEVELGVAEACSGLRMLIVFFALSTGLALAVERTRLERALIILSAAPIAVVVNIVRIATTALLYEAGHEALAEVVYHDLAGWLMMVLALGLLWAELWLFGRLITVVPSGHGAPVPLRPAAPARQLAPAGPSR